MLLVVATALGDVSIKVFENVDSFAHIAVVVEEKSSEEHDIFIGSHADFLAGTLEFSHIFQNLFHALP